MDCTEGEDKIWVMEEFWEIKLTAASKKTKQDKKPKPQQQREVCPVFSLKGALHF